MIPLWVAVAALVAGTALQQKASSDASRRQQQQISTSLQRQREYQRQAEKAALDRARHFAPESRQHKQEQLQAHMTDELMHPVREAATMPQDTSRVQGNVSSSYLTGRAQSQAEQLRAAQALARIFGQTMAAGRLRQNEVLGLADTGQRIDRLANYSRGQMGADQIGIQQAGIPNGWMQLGGGVMSALGQVGMLSSLAGTAKAGSGALAKTAVAL